MMTTSALRSKRDRLLLNHEKGVITTSEAMHGFIDILMVASDDDSCLQLCADLPSWFSDALHSALREMAKSDYYARTFWIGDTRTPDEIHRDALRRQNNLARIVPKILSVNPDVPPRP